MLVRRLGDEGRDILESDIGMDRLAVPRHEALFKREGKRLFIVAICYVLDKPAAHCLSDT
jgi:hypothetical protein